jgi:hypothetical protein
MVAGLQMPKWPLFRLYPVDNLIMELGGEDGSYSFDLVPGQQY